jgi:hypothetical protein
MLRKTLLLLGLCALSSISVQAQDHKVEVFGGYSYMRFESSNLNGFEVSGQYKLNDWLGGVADLGAHYGSISGIGTSNYTYLFGPQISVPSDKISPFGHLLIGGAHNSTGGVGRSSFSMALGGGIDAEMVHGLHWRLIQADYVMTQFASRSQNNFRFSTGIVLRFW